MRILIFICLPLLAGCLGPVNQAPNARIMGDTIHKRIMDAVPDYRLHSRQKALAACIKWPTTEDEPVYIDTLGSFALADQSDGKFSPGTIVDGAIRSCQGRQAKGGYDCTCQILDVAGTNRLKVPETIPSSAHPLRSRAKKRSSAAPWPVKTSKRDRPVIVCDTPNCKNFARDDDP